MQVAVLEGVLATRRVPRRRPWWIHHSLRHICTQGRGRLPLTKLIRPMHKQKAPLSKECTKNTTASRTGHFCPPDQQNSLQ